MMSLSSRKLKVFDLDVEMMMMNAYCIRLITWGKARENSILAMSTKIPLRLIEDMFATVG